MNDARSKLRILVVGKGAPERGGIATLVELLRDQLSIEHEAQLANLTREDEPSFGQLSVANLRRTAEDARTVWRAAAGRDVVNVHSALAPGTTMARAGVLALAGRLRRARVVIHAHGGNLDSWMRRPGRRLLAKLLLAPASGVITVSEDLHASLIGPVGEHRIRLVENGVDLDRFAPSQSVHAPPVVLFVGLLTPRKGVIDLLTASTILRERGVEHELVLAGGMPDEGPEVEAEVRAEAEGRATLLGSRPSAEMPEVYRRGTVFCLPSWWEAMPLSILEAMATGLPVVAADTGDVAKLVIDGETGTLVPPRRPEALADALQPYLDDATHATGTGARGRRRVEEHFGLDRMIDATVAAFRDALGSGAAG